MTGASLAPATCAAWAELARGWPIELGARWLAAEWGRVTPRTAVVHTARAAAASLVLDGRESRRGYAAFELLLDGHLDEARRDAGRDTPAERAQSAALRAQASPLGEVSTVTIATASACFPGLVWDRGLAAPAAEQAIADVVSRVAELARAAGAGVLAVANVPADAQFAPARAALAALGMREVATAPDTALAVPPGGLAGYLAGLRTAARRERRVFLDAVDRVTSEDATRLAAPDLVALLTRHRRKYGHLDPEDAYRDRLARARLSGDEIRVLVAERAGRAIGFVVLVLDPGQARVVPRLFACEDDTAFVYFNLAFYEPVEAAAAAGLSQIALGTTTYRAKLLRGARLSPRANWLLPLRAELRAPLAAAADHRDELEAARRASLARLES